MSLRRVFVRALLVGIIATAGATFLLAVSGVRCPQHAGRLSCGVPQADLPLGARLSRPDAKALGGSHHVDASTSTCGRPNTLGLSGG
jgi:hypothetical protein